MSQLRYMEDYNTFFDPKTYLDMFYKTFKGNEHEDGLLQFFVKGNHEFWSNFKTGAATESEVRLLEYGGGPSVASLVSACPKLDHIVFAEYTEANRQAVKSWISGFPEAHDWTPFVEFILQELEGWETHKMPTTTASSHPPVEIKSISQAIRERTDELKKKIKSIVPCDVSKTPIVQLEPADIGKPFDVVATSLCLEACVSSKAHYKKIVAELCSLLKPNGHLFMNGVLHQTFYCVGNEKFYTFYLSEEMVQEAMSEAGIEIEKFETMSTDYSMVSDCKAIFCTYGRKCA